MDRKFILSIMVRKLLQTKEEISTYNFTHKAFCRVRLPKSGVKQNREGWYIFDAPGDMVMKTDDQPTTTAMRIRWQGTKKKITRVKDQQAKRRIQGPILRVCECLISKMLQAQASAFQPNRCGQPYAKESTKK
jgi:hypothetical protein